MAPAESVSKEQTITRSPCPPPLAQRTLEICPFLLLPVPEVEHKVWGTIGKCSAAEPHPQPQAGSTEEQVGEETPL